MLKNICEKAAFTVKQFKADADVLIARTSIPLCSTFHSVFIIGVNVESAVPVISVAPS